MEDENENIITKQINTNITIHLNSYIKCNIY